jgi:hypothetical protein
MTTTVDGLHDQMISFDEDHHSGKQDTLIIKREQLIPNWYLDQLKDERIDTLHTPMGDLYRVCSIPISTVEKWKREGFDVHQEDVHAILARLRKESLDKFITTTKSF